MTLQSLTLKMNREKPYCMTSMWQDEAMLPNKCLKDYYKLKELISNGEHPDIGDNDGYLMCMCNDLLKNEISSNFV